MEGEREVERGERRGILGEGKPLCNYTTSQNLMGYSGPQISASSHSVCVCVCVCVRV